MTLGEKLSKLRKEYNYTQEQLADILGVTRQSISKWETDGSIPDLDRLIRLSEIFGVTLDELVKGMPEEQEATAVPENDPAFSQSTFSQADLRMQNQKRWGGALVLTAAGLSLLVLGFCPQNLSGFLPVTALMALLGGLCFVVRQRLGLVLGWTAWICVFSITIYASAVHMGGLLTLSYWKNTSPVVPLLALLQLGLLGLLTWRTLRNPPRLAVCWMVWLGILAALWLPLGLQMRTFSMSPADWFRDFFPLLTPAYYRAVPMGAILRWCHLLALVWLVQHSWRSMRSANRTPK